MDENQEVKTHQAEMAELNSTIPFRRQLRWVLILAFLILAVVPVALTVYIILGQVDTQAEKQVTNQLESVADLKRDQISRWLEDSRSALDLLLIDPDQKSQFTAFLDMTLDDGAGLDPERQGAINALLSRGVEVEHLFQELFLYNRRGDIVAGSNPVQISKVVTAQPYFNPSLNQDFIQVPYFEVGKGELTMLITRPLVDAQSGQTVGVLAGRLDINTLGQIMTRRTGLGETGETYLVSLENNYLLTPSRFEGYPLNRAYHSVAIDQVLNQKTDGSGSYDNYRGAFVFGVYRWAPELQAGLIAEIEETEALAPFLQARGISIGLASGTVLLAIIAGLIGAAYITRPITRLTQVAARIAAGDLSQQAEVRQRDEIGLLATAFNHMTAQLRELVGSLEERVSARTQRLEIAASLSEHLSAILNQEELLAEVVDQIKENFGFYHAHIYLLDEKQQRLVVAAGSGEAGAEMKAQGHSIALNAPTSLVARAARSGEIVRVDNVREAPDWLPNPLLPYTFSEMAVPIILDGKAVGVLDVQQDKIAGLDEGDANLLRTLANQAAVNIRNARLFNQVETALAEARIAQERYLSQAWEKGKLKTQNNQYHYARPDAPALDEITLSKAKQAALAQDRPALITAINGQESSSVIGNLLDHPKEISSLVAPINLQNKTIGALQLHAADDGRPWTEEDLELVAAVVDQLAQTAENLRLFEETRQRADFERLVGEITQKIRQSPNLEALTKTAAEVLGQALGASEGVIRLSVSTSKKLDNKGGNGHVH